MEFYVPIFSLYNLFLFQVISEFVYLHFSCLKVKMQENIKDGTFFRTIKPLLIILKYLGHCSIHNLQVDAATDIDVGFSLLYSCCIFFVHFIFLLNFLTPIEPAEFRIYLLFIYIVSLLSMIIMLWSDKSLKDFAVELDKYDSTYNSSKLNRIKLNVVMVLILIEFCVGMTLSSFLTHLKPIHPLVVIFCLLPRTTNAVLMVTIEFELAKRFSLLSDMCKSQKISFLKIKKESQYQLEEIRILHAKLTTLTNMFSHYLTCRLSILLGSFVLNSLIILHYIYKFGISGIFFFGLDNFIMGVLIFWITFVADDLVCKVRLYNLFHNNIKTHTPYFLFFNNGKIKNLSVEFFFRKTSKTYF